MFKLTVVDYDRAHSRGNTYTVSRYPDHLKGERVLETDSGYYVVEDGQPEASSSDFNDGR
jgi:hypothetical protein